MEDACNMVAIKYEGFMHNHAKNVVTYSCWQREQKTKLSFKIKLWMAQFQRVSIH